MKNKIYRVLDPGYCSDVKTGEAVPYLTYYDGAIKILSTDGKDASLEELVGLCDQDAESCNAHDFCGAHRLLGAVLYRHYGRQSATETMLEIAKFGGLHGMAGICRKGDAYKELQVGKAGYDWDGKYGK